MCVQFGIYHQSRIRVTLTIIDQVERNISKRLEKVFLLSFSLLTPRIFKAIFFVYSILSKQKVCLFFVQIFIEFESVVDEKCVATRTSENINCCNYAWLQSHYTPASFVRYGKLFFNFYHVTSGTILNFELLAFYFSSQRRRLKCVSSIIYLLFSQTHFSLS